MGSLEPEEPLRLGEQLRRIREALGLTLREVQAHTRISSGHLSLIETGQIKNPSPSVIQRLASLYRTDPKDLLTAAGYLASSDERARRNALAHLSLAAVEGLEESDLVEVQEFIRYLRQKKRQRAQRRASDR
jgi:transcriptional regulator with XRE-family HTH domain